MGKAAGVTQTSQRVVGGSDKTVVVPGEGRLVGGETR